MPPDERRGARPGWRVSHVPPDAQHRVQRTALLPAQLTTRELEVLSLMADGLFNREISTRLWLAEETVKSHVHHVLRKLGARSRAHAVAIGIRNGLID